VRQQAEISLSNKAQPRLSEQCVQSVRLWDIFRSSACRLTSKTHWNVSSWETPTSNHCCRLPKHTFPPSSWPTRRVCAQTRAAAVLAVDTGQSHLWFSQLFLAQRKARDRWVKNNSAAQYVCDHMSVSAAIRFHPGVAASDWRWAMEHYRKLLV